MCRTITKNAKDQLMITSYSKSTSGVVADASSLRSRVRTPGFDALALRKAAAGAGEAATGIAASQVDRRHSRLRVLDLRALKKVNKESHRIRKPSQFRLPAIQLKTPVIIHTCSPKIIHTEPESFMSLVQELTGSSDTQLRRLKDGSTSMTDNDVLQQQDGMRPADQYSTDHRRDQSEHQTVNSLSVSSLQWSSPASSSSEEEQTKFASSGLAKNILKLKCDDSSPKGPLPSYESQDEYSGPEFWNPNVFFSAASAFDQLQATVYNPASVIKREPLSLDRLCFSDLGFLAAELMGSDDAARTCSSSTRLALLQSSQVHDQEHTTGFAAAAAGVFGASGSTLSSCVDGSYPSNYELASAPGNDLSPGFTVDNLPIDHLLSPTSTTTMWSSSSSLEYNCWNTMSSTASPLPFAHTSLNSLTPGKMVSLRDIQAMNDDDPLKSHLAI